MTGLRHNLRLSLIAFAAAVGALSVASDVSASNTGPQNGARACCLKRACSVCCCEPAAVASPVHEPADPRFTGAGLAGRTAPPCECRSNGPAAPAPGPESRPGGQRIDPGHGESVVLTIDVPSAETLARHLRPAARLSKAPLHLRTTRLLI